MSGNYFLHYKGLSASEEPRQFVQKNNPLPVLIYSADGLVTAYVDPFTGAIGTIEQEHLQIHEGKGYTLTKRVIIANVGGTYEFLIVVPADAYPHLRHIIVSSDGGPSDVDLYEDTGVSDPGTEIDPYNNNRNSTNTPDMRVYDSPTVTADGTLIEPILIPGTKQSGSFGSEGSNEWILKQNATYMLRITNNTVGVGTSNYVLNLYWYEG